MRIKTSVFIRSLMASSIALTSVGCNMLPHNLQPHRLWMLNRGSASSRQSPYFSIRDRIRHPGQTVSDPTAPAIELGESVPIGEALE